MAHRSFSVSRRDFPTQSMAATGLSVGAASLYPVVSAGQAVTGRTREKIRMGFIGVGNRGTQLLTEFRANPDVLVTGLCDVYEANGGAMFDSGEVEFLGTQGNLNPEKERVTNCPKANDLLHYEYRKPLRLG
ncbi:MAG: hypothetical protein GY809_23625 [Planctomycetes bacterium]|nr:hypothetical protein [Planctomycetota bacterium]